MKESPAEKMHNRILTGASFSTRDVTVDAFQEIAQRAGTSNLADIKKGLEILRDFEKLKKKV